MLTDEQKKRIEENKRKALEKRSININRAIPTSPKFTTIQEKSNPPSIAVSPNSFRKTSYSPSFRKRIHDEKPPGVQDIPKRKSAFPRCNLSKHFDEQPSCSKNQNQNTHSTSPSPRKSTTSYSPSFRKSIQLDIPIDVPNQFDLKVGSSPTICKYSKTEVTSPQSSSHASKQHERGPPPRRSIFNQLERASESSSCSKSTEDSNVSKEDIDQTDNNLRKRAEINKLKALEKLKLKKIPSSQMSSLAPGNQNNDLHTSTETIPIKSSQENGTVEIGFSVNSPIWFRLDCQSNDLISAVVQKIKNRNYDKGSYMFHIKDYRHVVTQFENISNIKIKHQIPPSTVKILQYAHEEQKRKPLEKMDISKIDGNILQRLMSFQKVGVQFAIQKKGRVLIADDMGLGKTIQAIAICNYYIDDWPILIICPSSVKMSWQEHFLIWMPTLREDDVNIIHTGKDRITSSSSVTIMSCDLASKMAQEIERFDFQIIIVDESHSLKNSQAKRTKNLIPILQNAKRALLLSGTPALSRPKELFTQISALRRDLFKSYFKFAKRYCDAKEGRFGLEDDGCSNTAELNAILKSTVMLRRMKYEVLDELPAKMRQIVTLDPSLIKISKELKDNEKAFLSSKGKKDNRAPLLQYYGSTSIAKIKGVLQFICEKLDSTQEKIIIFAHHVQMLDAIEEETRNKNIESIRISGNTASKARQALVDVFNNHASCKLAILSLTAAGTGLNMASSSLVIFAELYWNPGHLIQAEDRAHRIGQKNSVQIIYLVARQTADDYIWPLVKNKLNILTTLGVGTKRGLDNTKNTEAKHQTKISDFCNKSFLDDDELDNLFVNLQEDGIDEEMAPEEENPQKKRKLK